MDVRELIINVHGEVVSNHHAYPAGPPPHPAPVAQDVDHPQGAAGGNGDPSFWDYMLPMYYQSLMGVEDFEVMQGGNYLNL